VAINNLSEAAAILNISTDATEAEVRSAYRKASLREHPDKIQQNLPKDLSDEEKDAAMTRAKETFQDIGNAKDLFDEHFEQQNAQQSQSEPEPEPKYDTYSEANPDEYDDFYDDDFEDTTSYQEQKKDNSSPNPRDPENYSFVDETEIRNVFNNMLDRISSAKAAMAAATFFYEITMLENTAESQDILNNQIATDSNDKSMTFDDLISEYENSEHGKNSPPSKAEDGSVNVKFASEKDAIKFMSDMAEKGYSFTMQDASGNALASSDGTGLTRPDGSSLKDAESFKNDAEEQQRPTAP